MVSEEEREAIIIGVGCSVPFSPSLIEPTHILSNCPQSVIVQRPILGGRRVTINQSVHLGLILYAWRGGSGRVV